MEISSDDVPVEATHTRVQVGHAIAHDDLGRHGEQPFAIAVRKAVPRMAPPNADHCIFLATHHRCDHLLQILGGVLTVCVVPRNHVARRLPHRAFQRSAVATVPLVSDDVNAGHGASELGGVVFGTIVDDEYLGRRKRFAHSDQRLPDPSFFVESGNADAQLLSVAHEGGFFTRPTRQLFLVRMSRCVSSTLEIVLMPRLQITSEPHHVKLRAISERLSNFVFWCGSSRNR